MVSYLFEGSFKKQAKFNRFVQQWKETVTLTLEPVPVHSEKATAESSHAIPSSAFPAVFIIPKFPRDVQTKLDQKPPCKIERSDHNKIIRTLYETMALIKMFPTNDDYVKVCKALILKYPFLKDKEGNGYHTWHMSLKRKFKYERVPLIDDEEVRRMKLKFGHHKKPLQHEENTSKRAKTSKEVDIIGEDDTSVAGHVKVLQDQYRKTQPDVRMVEERMMRTFAWRRREIANGMTVEEAINKYPFLKSPCRLFQEMGRLHDEMNICRRFEDGFKVLVPTVLRLTQRKSPLADLALEEREAALTEDVPGIDFRAAILLLPILFREKNDVLVILGEDQPPSPYPTVQLDAVADWRTVLTRRVPAVVKLDGQSVCMALGLEEGVIAAFCAYFIYNVVYPSRLKNTLIFIQRYVLKMSEVGDKPLPVSVTRVINILA
ncbi:sterile alpha motif domain-containing protein 3-like [Perca fluviatilis]|nr:sterile alpha motif domain-containing protein 3-like [Perca fluviatilis]